MPRKFEILDSTACPVCGAKDGKSHSPRCEVLKEMAAKGYIADSGRKRWSSQTRSWQIVWVAVKAPPA